MAITNLEKMVIGKIKVNVIRKKGNDKNKNGCSKKNK